MTQILVVKPKTLTAADKKLLRDAGVVCVEAKDPASVRMLQPDGAQLASNDLLAAAMKAIASDSWQGNTKDAFADNVAALVKAANAT